MVAELHELDDQEGGEVTRRGLLVRAGTSAAAASLLSLGGPAAALAAPAAQTQSGVLRLNQGSEPQTVDPQKASFVGEIGIIMRVFRNLLTFDKDQNLIPDQAADLPVVEDDGTTLTFTLKPDITFSDGVPVTAHHFEYGWKRHLDPLVAGDYAFTGYNIVGAEEYNTANTKSLSAAQLQALRDAVGVTALDGSTIQFRLKSAAPWFMSVLATWCGLPARQDLISAGNGGNEHESKWTEPATYIGNGPYILTEWEHQNRMHMQANPNFLPAPAPIKDIEFAMIVEDAVQFAAYLNDELDVAGVSSPNKPRVDGDPVLRSQFHQYPGSCDFYIGMNTQRPPFDNQKVRAAFSYALDRTGFVRNILGGQGIPARQFVPPGFPGYYEFELEEQTFNPTVAQRLLAEAGFPGGRGLPQIKMSFSSTALNRLRSEAIASDYKKHLGVDILLDPVESTAYTAMLKKQETTPQMFRLGWCQDYPDPQNWYSTVFHSKSTVSHTGWKSAEFDQLTEQADIEQDLDRRKELYRQAAQILLNEAPVAFHYYNVAWALVKPRIKNFRPDPLEYFFGEHNLYNMTLAD
ncbi:MAG: peptide ABC transporter substrate-binding protein [Chloroflexi bacterium]|nr:peptide ABC transporter substrate-binding protein [Chloroflexota bacterium]